MQLNWQYCFYVIDEFCCEDFGLIKMKLLRKSSFQLIKLHEGNHLSQSN